MPTQPSWVGPQDSVDEALVKEVVRTALWVVGERRALEFQLALGKFLGAARDLLEHRS